MKNYFFKEITALKMVGISLDGYKSYSYMIYSFLIIVGLISTYTVLATIELFKHEFEVVADIIVYQSGGIIALAKVIVITKNRVQFGKILSKLHQEPFLPNTNRGGDIEIKLINECVRVTSLQTTTYWCLTLLTICTSITLNLIKKMKSSNYAQLPYGPLSLLNTTRSYGYEISFIYQCTSVAVYSFTFITIDSLICAVLAHICYQFKILQNNFKQMINVNCKNNGSKKKRTAITPISHKQLHNSLEEVITHHVAIFDIINQLESTINKLMLVAFLETLILICFSMYKGSLTTNPTRLLRYMGEAGSSALQIALFSYWGEQINQESKNVGMAVYESNFFDADISIQRDLSFVIRRTQKVTTITVGKFTNISVTTFAWIIQTSYSYFMVLRKSIVRNIPEEMG